jgi:hypothetical protein
MRTLLGVWTTSLVFALTTLLAPPAAAQTGGQSVPFSGAPVMLPGTINAEDYDLGGEGVAYHDTSAGNWGTADRQDDVDIEASTDGGFDVGWLDAGEWLNYTVNVPAAGSYVLDAAVTAPGPGGTFHVEFNGVNVTGPLTIPDTGGWQTWVSVSAPVTLTAGVQVARVVFDGFGSSGFIGNLNWFRISPPRPTVSVPYTGSAHLLPGVIPVEQYDLGGEGQAYHDTTAGNFGGSTRRDDVDLEASSLGTIDIGWTDAGEWVNYGVFVPTAGSYLISLQVASPLSTGALHVNVGAVALETLAVPVTGDWQTWQTMTWTATLPAGPQILQLVVDTPGFNMTARRHDSSRARRHLQRQLHAAPEERRRLRHHPHEHRRPGPRRHPHHAGHGRQPRHHQVEQHLHGYGDRALRAPLPPAAPRLRRQRPGHGRSPQPRRRLQRTELPRHGAARPHRRPRLPARRPDLRPEAWHRPQ